MKFHSAFSRLLGTVLLGGGLILGLGSCGDGEASLSGRAEDPCIQSIPACPGLFAQCVLDPASYARVRFPGSFRFFANVEAGHEVEVVLYFADQRDSGIDTKIFWNEPGCTDIHEYKSQGLNLFVESEDTGVFTVRRQMIESGEHLIEVFSDMDADTLVTVNIHIPGTE